MTKVIYEIVEHDGGWAYRVDGVFSETFPSHDMAREAAERAAKEQILPGETKSRPAETGPRLMSQDEGKVRLRPCLPLDTRRRSERCRQSRTRIDGLSCP
jgi:hypothetical protein